MAKTVDVGSLLDAGPWSGYQKLLVGVTALTIVVDGFDNQLLASVASFGVLTAPVWVVDHVFALGVLRFLTGIGLGGAMPNSSPRR